MGGGGPQFSWILRLVLTHILTHLKNYATQPYLDFDFFGTKMLMTMIFFITNVKCKINLILMNDTQRNLYDICYVKKDKGRENKLYITKFELPVMVLRSRKVISGEPGPLYQDLKIINCIEKLVIFKCWSDNTNCSLFKAHRCKLSKTIIFCFFV